MSYTEGRWHYRNGNIESDAHENLILAKIHCSARVEDPDANGRLMAAAPEMLEALKACIKEVYHSTPQVRAAIAKAEGE